MVRLLSRLGNWMTKENDDWQPETVSLCRDCAKDPELKALVESDLTDGVCGLCGSSASKVYNPARFAEARNLIRALIRFHFNEQDYNPGYGGTSIGTILLDEPNPIVEMARSNRYADAFIHRITWEGGMYPDPDKGIRLYAGDEFNAEQLLYFSISETAPRQLRNIEDRLKRENFHAVEDAMEKLVAGMEADIEFQVPKYSLWYRGRIGIARRGVGMPHGEVVQIATPHKGTAIGARLPPDATAGRTNRQGVSVLYLASEIETALAEIRPHPGHLISIGGFRAEKNLRIARFDLPIGNFASSEDRLDLFALIQYIDWLLSFPIIPEERHRYAVTQLLSDVLIRHGFEGVTYRSSVGTGRNLCVFDPSAFAFDESASAVKRVNQLHYTFSDVDMPDPT